jgi:hypothetical protein
MREALGFIPAPKKKRQKKKKKPLHKSRKNGYKIKPKHSRKSENLPSEITEPGVYPLGIPFESVPPSLC